MLFVKTGVDHTFPKLTESYALMEDSYVQPLSRCEAAENTRTALLSLRGLNDYSHQAIINQRLDAFWKFHSAFYT